MIQATALIAKFQQSLDEEWGYIYGKSHTMWSAAKQKAYNEAKKDDSDCQNSIRYGPKWYGHWVTDCSGLFSYWFGQLGGKMYHGSHTMFNSWTTDKGQLKNGKRTDGKELKPGTAVFVWNEKKKRYSHVGLYIGGGWVIEAACAKDGVCRSKITNSKWEYWGELKGVEYDAQDSGGQPSEADQQDAAQPTIRRGSKGTAVKTAQKLLTEKGYKLPKYGADGDFGSETEAAVKQFQKDWGLEQDGVIGPDTWKILNSAPAKKKTYTVTITGLDKAAAQELCAKYKTASMKEEGGS